MTRVWAMAASSGSFLLLRLLEELIQRGAPGPAGVHRFNHRAGERETMDFTTLTAAVDFDTVVTAVLAIGALKVLPLVAAWGTRKVLAMVGR